MGLARRPRPELSEAAPHKPAPVYATHPWVAFQRGREVNRGRRIEHAGSGRGRAEGNTPVAAFRDAWVTRARPLLGAQARRRHGRGRARWQGCAAWLATVRADPVSVSDTAAVRAPSWKCSHPCRSRVHIWQTIHRCSVRGRRNGHGLIALATRGGGRVATGARRTGRPSWAAPWLGSAVPDLLAPFPPGPAPPPAPAPCHQEPARPHNQSNPGPARPRARPLPVSSSSRPSPLGLFPRPPRASERRCPARRSAQQKARPSYSPDRSRAGLPSPPPRSPSLLARPPGGSEWLPRIQDFSDKPRRVARPSSPVA